MGRWHSTQQFRGMNSLRSALSIPPGMCADSLNSDLGSSTQAGPELGYKRFGNQANDTDRIVRRFTFTRGDGSEVTLQVRDDATNYIVEYLNYADIRNNSNGEWSILEGGLTRTRNIKDGTQIKARIDFAPFNDTGTDQLVYGNGVEGLRIWNGAIGKITAVTATTITIAGPLTPVQLGFSASGSLRVNGTTYTYSGITGQQFTGVSGSPASEPLGSGVTQAVDSSTLSSVDKGSILLSAHQRLYLAGISATPNQITYSDVGDITNYAGTTPSDGGFDDLPQLNGAINGLSYIGEWILVFSEKKVIGYKLDYPTSTTKTTRVQDISDEGCANYKAVKKYGDTVIYMTPNGGMKQIRSIQAKDVFNVDNLTQPIRPTLEKFDWSDCSLEYSRKKQVIFAAGMSDPELTTVNDRGVALYFSLDEANQPIMNLGIMDWFVGDMCIYQGDLHFGSSASSHGYRAFDGYSKDGGPYKWRRTERIETYGNVWEQKWPVYFAVRGAISSGTTLNITFKYGLGGSLSQPSAQLIGTESGFVVQQALNTLGAFELGTEPLGGTIAAISSLNPFEVMFPLPNIYPKDFQVEFSTEGVGQIVVIETYGAYVENVEQQVTQDFLH